MEANAAVAETVDDEALILAVSIHIAASPEKVWEVMTTRQEAWWCPAPWRIEIIEQDWRGGGRCAMNILGPNGEVMPNEGVFLEVVPGKHFVSTDAFTVGWKPTGPFMVGTWAIAPEGEGTRYTGSARHWGEEAYEQHQAMGFINGWAAVARQLKSLCEAG